MPRLRALKATPLGRLFWIGQMVLAGIRELEPRERTHARELVQKLFRERRLSKKDRDQLLKFARKVGGGAARGAGPRAFRKRK
jgi:hypothetical protein